MWTLQNRIEHYEYTLMILKWYKAKHIRALDGIHITNKNDFGAHYVNTYSGINMLFNTLELVISKRNQATVYTL